MAFKMECFSFGAKIKLQTLLRGIETPLDARRHRIASPIRRQDGRQTTPRQPQDAPRRPQETPTCAQDAHKNSPRPPKTPEEASKTCSAPLQTSILKDFGDVFASIKNCVLNDFGTLFGAFG